MVIFSCNNKEIDANLKHLNHVANKINCDLESISSDLIDLAYKIEHSVPFQDEVSENLFDSYSLSKNNILYTIFSNDNSAVYFPAKEEISKSLKNQIIQTEKLDLFFREIVKSNTLISQVYFLNTYSFLRIYPYIDVTNYLKNSLNLTQLITYNSIKNKPFNSRKAYWINNPFADPYGRGWVISCAEPLYYRDHFKGIISIDLSLKSIKSKYFSSNTESLFLLNGEGKLIAFTKEAGKALNAPAYKEFQYYKPVEEDIFIYNSPSLLNHQNKSIKKAIKNLLDDKTNEDFYVDNKKYKIYKSYIPITDWYIFKIIN